MEMKQRMDRDAHAAAMVFPIGHYWLFGHYHNNSNLTDKHVLLWEQIVQVL